MKYSAGVVSSAWVLAWVVALSAQAANVLWTGTHPEQVSDPAYGMTAYTIPVPNGWKFVGTILRPAGCHPAPTPAAGLSFSSVSPDGVTARMMLPGVSWSWDNDKSGFANRKCAPIDINTAYGFLLNIAVPNLHPNAKIEAVVPLPQPVQAALAAQLQKAREQNAAMAQAYGQKPQTLVLDGAQVRIEYEENGQPMEEMVGTLIDCMESQTVALPKQPSYTRRLCSSRGTFLARAGKGHLDELAAQPPTPPQINKAWDERVIQDMKADFQRIQAASDQAFKAMTQKMQADTQRMVNQSERFRAQQQASTNAALANDRASQAAIDNAAHQTSLAVLGRQTFVNPSTGQKIEASSEYNHQWISSDGSTLIQTQDHTLDPNGVVYPVSQSWTELVPQR